MSDTQTVTQATSARPRPALSEADLRDIECQINDDTPVYVFTLIRDLRDARELLAQLVEVRR